MTIKCPACHNGLTERTVGSINVDVCEGGCGGIWFDNHELKKVDNARESSGEALLDIERNGAAGASANGKRMCPRCDDQPMMQHFASPQKEVEVDECPGCGGTWLDCGELALIRAQFASEDERRKAFDAYFKTVFGEELARMEAESQANAAKAQRFARMFRFICPSAYVPGKQSWGAF